jgi:hypothetical protein
VKLLRDVGDELAGVALRLALLPVSRVLSGSAARAAPRALAQGGAFAACGWVDALTQGGAWDDGEWGALLGTGRLSSSAPLAAPFPPLSPAFNGVSLPPCASNASGAGEVVAQVVGTSEQLVFVADLWALDSSGGGAAPRALGRAVHRAASWLLYRPGFPAAGAGAGAALYANVSATAEGGGAHGAAAAASWAAGFGLAGAAAAAAPPAATLLPPCALALRPSSFSWTAAGAPADVRGASAAAAAAYHVVSGTAPGGATTFSLPPGTLNPGWVYRVTATAAAAAGWTWDCAPAPWADAFPGVGGGGGAGRAYDVAATSPPLAVPAARPAPLLYVHAPRTGGGLSLAPRVGGKALITNFEVGAAPGQWADGDALAVGGGRPSPQGAALAYAGAAPLPPAVAALLWGAVAAARAGDSGALSPGQWGQASAAMRTAGGSDCGQLPGEAGEALSSAGAGAPAWTRLYAAAAAALRLPPPALCAAAAGAAATALANEPTATSLAPAPTLTFSFRVDASAAAAGGGGRWWPLGLPAPDSGGAVAPGAVGAPALQARLGVPPSWPGAALGAVTGSAGGAAVALTAPLPAPGSATGAHAAADMSGRLVVLLFVTDVDGGVGVALTNATLAPVPSSLTLAEDLAAISAVDAAGCNSQSALLRVSAASASLDSAGVPGAPAVVASLLSTAAAALSCQESSAGRSGGGGGGGAAAPVNAGVVIDDAALTSTVATLASLSANSEMLGAAGRASALAAVDTLLSLSTPLNVGAGGGGGTLPLPAAVPAFPPAAGDAALTVIANVMASDVVTTTAASGAGGSVPAGGLSAATAGAMAATLDTLHAAMLRAAAPGDPPVTFSSAPSAATAAGGGAFCGAALSLTAARIDASLDGGGALPGAASYAGSVGGQHAGALPSGAFSVPLGAPLNPCPGASGAAGGGAVTLPPALVAAQPPPTLSIPRELLGALGGSVTVKMVQWGVSPFNETLGLPAMGYPPLPSEQALDLARGGRAGELPTAEAEAGGGARRALSVLWAPPHAVARRAEASSSLTASLGALPNVASVPDRLPGRPLDTRVVSVELTSRGGAPLTRFSSPVFVTLPLRDLSIVQWDAAAGAASAVGVVGEGQFPRLSYAVTCPSSLLGLRAGGAVPARLTGPPEAVAAAWRRGPWSNATSGAALAAALAAGAPASLTLLSASSLRFNSSLQEFLALPPDAGGVVTAPGGVTSSDLSAGGDALGSATLRAAAAVAQWGVAFALTAPCGALGNKTFVCGPGSGGRTVTYTCPRVVPVPACLYYDSARGAWSSEGCAVAGVTATAVICACTHLTPLAARFAALEQSAVDAYAAEVPSRLVVRWTAYGVHVLLLLVLGGVAGLGTLRGWVADARAEPLYAAALAAQEPVAALRTEVEAEDAAAAAEEAAAAAAAARSSPGGAGARRRKRSAAAAAASAAATAAPRLSWVLDRAHPKAAPLPPSAPPAALLDLIARGDALLGAPWADDPAQVHAGITSALWHRCVGMRRRVRAAAPAPAPAAAPPPADPAAVAPAPAPAPTEGAAAAAAKEEGGVSGAATPAPAPALAILAGQFALLSAASRAPLESPASAWAAVAASVSAPPLGSSSRPSTPAPPAGARNGGGAGAPRARSYGATFFATFWARVRWGHRLGVLYPWTDPRHPRTSRWALAGAFDLISLLFLAAWAYAYTWGRTDPKTGALLFPALSARGVLALGCGAALGAALLHAVARALLRAADEWEWAARFPHLAAEWVRRGAAERLLARLPLSLLLEQEARLRALAGAGAGGGAAPPQSPLPHHWDTLDAERLAGWASPPAPLVAFAPWLLSACGRHPSQRRAAILAAREEAEEGLWRFAPPAVAEAARRGAVRKAPRSAATVAPAPFTATGSGAGADGAAAAAAVSAQAVALVHAWSAQVDSPAARLLAPPRRLCGAWPARGEDARAGGDGGAPRRPGEAPTGLLGAGAHVYHLCARATARALAVLDGAPAPRATPQQRAAAEALARLRARACGARAPARVSVLEEERVGEGAGVGSGGVSPARGAAASEEAEEAAVAAEEAEEEGAEGGRRTRDAAAAAWTARHIALQRRGAGCCEARRGVPWRPTGCAPRTAALRAGGLAYLTFAAVFVFLFGRAAGEAVTNSLVGAFAVALVVQWALLPLLRSGAEGLYFGLLLPGGLAAALAWVPWLGAASGAVGALRLAAAAPALAEEAAAAAAAAAAAGAEEEEEERAGAEEDAARAAGVRLDTPLPPSALAVLRDACGGALTAPLRAALFAASAVASADALPLRHVPAFAVAGAAPSLACALGTVFAGRLAAAAGATGVGGGDLAASRAALAQLRLRQALTAAIYGVLRAGGGKLGLPPPEAPAPATPPAAPRAKQSPLPPPPPPPSPPLPAPPLSAAFSKAENTGASPRASSPPPTRVRGRISPPAPEPNAPFPYSSAGAAAVSTAPGDALGPGSPRARSGGKRSATDKEIVGLLRELAVAAAEYETVKASRRSPLPLTGAGGVAALPASPRVHPSPPPLSPRVPASHSSPLGGGGRRSPLPPPPYAPPLLPGVAASAPAAGAPSPPKGASPALLRAAATGRILPPPPAASSPVLYGSPATLAPRALFTTAPPLRSPNLLAAGAAALTLSPHGSAPVFPLSPRGAGGALPPWGSPLSPRSPRVAPPAPPPPLYAPPAAFAPPRAAFMHGATLPLPLPLARPPGQLFGPLGALGMSVFPVGFAPRPPPPRLLGARGSMLPAPLAHPLGTLGGPGAAPAAPRPRPALRPPFAATLRPPV